MRIDKNLMLLGNGLPQLLVKSQELNLW